VVLIAEDLRQAFRRIARRVGGAASQVATRI